MEFSQTWLCCRWWVPPCFALQSAAKPPASNSTPLFTTINHLFCFFFFIWHTDWECFSFWKPKQLLGSVSHTGLLSARLLVKVCQVFLKPLSPLLPAPASSPVVSWRCWPGYRCWPVVPLFEMCSPRLSLEGNGDELISPEAHSPGKEGNIKKKRERREAEGARCFTEHLPPQLKPTLATTTRKKKKKSISWIYFIWN